MKKFSLALVALAGLGLAACSSQTAPVGENAYKGNIVFSQTQGENLQLTIRKNDCSGNQQEGEQVVITRKYDSSLVVGACVIVSGDEKVTNVSTLSPRNPL